jgi:hypothetical protein
VRIDCAFFSDEIASALEALGILYAVSVPFERFLELKVSIEERLLWWRADRITRFFPCHWKPKRWHSSRRFLFIRTRESQQRKDPLLLTLFAQYEYSYQFKAILTNIPVSARNVLALITAAVPKRLSSLS